MERARAAGARRRPSTAPNTPSATASAPAPSAARASSFAATARPREGTAVRLARRPAARSSSTASPQTMADMSGMRAPEKLGVGVRAQRRVPSGYGEVLAAGKTGCQAADEVHHCERGARQAQGLGEQGPRESHARRRVGESCHGHHLSSERANQAAPAAVSAANASAQTARPASVSMPSAASAPAERHVRREWLAARQHGDEARRDDHARRRRKELRQRHQRPRRTHPRAGWRAGRRCPRACRAAP